MADDDPPRPPDIPDADPDPALDPDPDPALDPDLDPDRNASDDVPGTAGPTVPPAAVPPTVPPAAVPPVPPRAPTWAGRAEVPARGRGGVGGPPVDWSYGDEPDDRRWWMPIVVGVIALVLVTVLVAAGWVIVESARRDRPAPPLPATTTPAATPGPTSAVPTTTPPSPTETPSATASTTVVVPPLVGLPEQEAVELLEQFGLVPQLRFRGSDRPAGTVLETNPPAGREVAPGDQVTLVIAEPRPDPPTTPVPTIATPPEQDG